MNKIKLASLLVVVLAAFPAQAFHGSTCSKSGMPEIVTQVTQDQVEQGEYDHWKLEVPSGMQGFVHVQPLNGDADVTVCKTGSSHVCEGANTLVIGDGCHVSEVNDPSGEDLYSFGAPLGAGTYRLDIQHCFSSHFGPGCDYSPNNDGALDAAGPIHYLVVFTTN